MKLKNLNLGVAVVAFFAAVSCLFANLSFACGPCQKPTDTGSAGSGSSGGVIVWTCPAPTNMPGQPVDGAPWDNNPRSVLGPDQCPGNGPQLHNGDVDYP